MFLSFSEVENLQLTLVHSIEMVALSVGLHREGYCRGEWLNPLSPQRFTAGLVMRSITALQCMRTVLWDLRLSEFYMLDVYKDIH